MKGAKILFKYEPELIESTLLNTYHRAYEFEIERKDAFGNKQNFIVAVITLIAGVATALLSKLPIESCIWSDIFYFLLIPTYILLGVSLIFLGYALKNRKYSYLSNLQDIDKIVKSLHKPNSSQHINIANEFNNFLVNRYCEAASHNRENNRIRIGYYTKTLNTLYITVILLFLLIGCFAICQYMDNGKPQQIEITKAVITSLPNSNIKVINPIPLDPFSIAHSPLNLSVSTPECTNLQVINQNPEITNLKSEDINDSRKQSR